MTNTALNVIERTNLPDLDEFGLMMRDYRMHLRARGLADGTVRQRLNHIYSLHAHFPNVLAVTTTDLEGHLSQRRHTLKPETRRSIRNSWQRFYAWAHKTGLIDVNPAADLEPVRLPRTMARIADDTLVLRGLETASLPEKAMVLLGRLAALRLSEITTLHTDDREGDVLRILGKGEHVRMVPINDELLDVLERLEHLQGDGYYFRGRWNGSMHPQAVNKIITRVTSCNPHSLRHAAATAAYEGTHDLRAVQEMLGHSSLATTERYLHVRADQIRAAAQATSLGLHAKPTTAIERTFLP
ncbi:MAG: hypothetical protein EPN48_11750 [Microbacteriaceae bacterium]|nr:MAG: hypothetical protein EPN48_11750 [Microbacteriaceae bacterium]